MILKFVLAAAVVAPFVLAATAQADTLDTHAAKHHRAVADSGAAPGRGMSMAQVERRYGAPLEKLPSAGGDTARHPTINRWRYNGYTVYFERSRVIHSVFDTAAATPKS
jgi:hypothetical protein